jgi:hypothetical protein
MLVGSGAFDGMTPLVRHVHVNGYGGKGYDSVVDWGGLGRLAGYLTQLQIPKRVFLITDSNLHRPCYSIFRVPDLSLTSMLCLQVRRVNHENSSMHFMIG